MVLPLLLTLKVGVRWPRKVGFLQSCSLVAICLMKHLMFLTWELVPCLSFVVRNFLEMTEVDHRGCDLGLAFFLFFPPELLIPAQTIRLYAQVIVVISQCFLCLGQMAEAFCVYDIGECVLYRHPEHLEDVWMHHQRMAEVRLPVIDLHLSIV